MVLIFLERLITMSHNVCVHSGPSAFSFMHRSPNLQRTQYDNIRDTPDFFSSNIPNIVRRDAYYLRIMSYDRVKFKKCLFI